VRAIALALVLGLVAEAGSVGFARLDLRGVATNGIFADDLDGDGRPDLVALGPGEITVLRAKGAPSPIYPGMPGYFAMAPGEVRDWGKLCRGLMADGPLAARVRQNLAPAIRNLVARGAKETLDARRPVAQARCASTN